MPYLNSDHAHPRMPVHTAACMSTAQASAKEEGLDGDAGPESPRHEGALALDGLNTYDVGAAIDSIGV